MEFDLLVRKYLRGTLSPSELERLRDLLERVPEYRTELRQILELRSIIHDDALRLVPPRELSERTRQTVGAQFGLESLLKHDAERLATPGELSDATRMAVGHLFASAAPAVEEKEERKRRAMILPYRVMGRALLAASFAVMVALAPTLLTPTLDTDGRTAAVAPGRASRPSTGGPTGGSPSSSTNTSTASAPSTEALAGVVGDAGRGLTNGRDASVRATRGGSSASDGAARAAGASMLPASSEAAIAYGPEIPVDLASSARTDFAIPPLDPDNPISSMVPIPLRLSNGDYQPASDTSMRRAEPFAVLDLAPHVVPGVEPDSRLLSVGVTLGSGNVMDAETPAALMQNSYYFSFNVSGTDRIGIEMGGSKFMQETAVPDKRPVGNIFAKQGAGDTSMNSPVRGNGSSTPTVMARMEQDITYGGVFYDRRLEVDRAWDVCGRVTFGAADGGLVAGVRAYTAYSPTKNVTLTLGIGGSTLFDLGSRNDDASTNYGLYYGVETGF